MLRHARHRHGANRARAGLAIRPQHRGDGGLPALRPGHRARAAARAHGRGVRPADQRGRPQQHPGPRPYAADRRRRAHPGRRHHKPGGVLRRDFSAGGGQDLVGVGVRDQGRRAAPDPPQPRQGRAAGGVRKRTPRRLGLGRARQPARPCRRLADVPGPPAAGRAVRHRLRRPGVQCTVAASPAARDRHRAAPGRAATPRWRSIAPT